MPSFFNDCLTSQASISPDTYGHNSERERETDRQTQRQREREEVQEKRSKIIWQDSEKMNITELAEQVFNIHSIGKLTVFERTSCAHRLYCYPFSGRETIAVFPSLRSSAETRPGTARHLCSGQPYSLRATNKTTQIVSRVSAVYISTPSPPGQNNSQLLRKHRYPALLTFSEALSYRCDHPCSHLDYWTVPPDASFQTLVRPNQLAVCPPSQRGCRRRKGYGSETILSPTLTRPLVAPPIPPGQRVFVANDHVAIRGYLFHQIAMVTPKHRLLSHDTLSLSQSYK